jgi:hypothetical protein
VVAAENFPDSKLSFEESCKPMRMMGARILGITGTVVGKPEVNVYTSLR